MNPDDLDDNPGILSGGLGRTLLGARPLPTGLAEALGYAGPSVQPPAGLGLDLGARDPGGAQGPGSQLRDVTSDPKQPTFQTPYGTRIQLNKPAPATVLPYGDALGRLMRFADQTGLGQVRVSGGAELAGHSAHSTHYQNKAVDIAGPQYNDLDGESVRQAALAAGYTHGVYEIRSDGPHWHLQYGAGNGLDDRYDLSKGPLKTKDYTQDPKKPGNKP